MNKKQRYFLIFIVLTVVFIYIFMRYIPRYFSIEDYFVYIIMTLVIVFSWLAIHFGAVADNQALLKRIQQNPTVRISHRLTDDNFIRKLKCGAFEPYPVKSCRLLKGFAELQDGKAPATWVSIGEPHMVNQIFLGSISPKKWTRAISFEVASTEIVMPPTFLKHLFGCSQQRLLNRVEIPANADLYRLVGNKWEKFHGVERQELLSAGKNQNSSPVAGNTIAKVAVIEVEECELS